MGGWGGREGGFDSFVLYWVKVTISWLPSILKGHDEDHLVLNWETFY